MARVTYRFLYVLLVPLIRIYWRIRVRGRENIPRNTGLIIASNHWSGVDPIMVCSSFWRPVHWLAKVELVVTKSIAWFFRMAAVIPVNRDAPQQESIDKASAVLRRGGIFGIYPEGTRSVDGKLHKGYTGVARIAAQSDAPVIPTAVMGTRESVPKGKKVPRPVGVEVRFGPPLLFAMQPGEDDKVAYRRFTNEIMHAIAKLSGQEYVDEYNRRRKTDPHDE
ncbi:MAG: lysophospholipid acyltransferase family protein [Actinomycetota bacterium]|nr:1-acyl-sn-glycerol-3-phosphate acyltransferase [Actinomycetota bacterium]